jgi:hypothetical protein
MIQSFLQTAGIDTFEARIDEDVWLFRRGSAGGHIALIDDPEQPEWSRLYVSYAVMRVPLEQAAAFYRRLLELNDHFGGLCSFSVDASDVVWLNAGRRLEGLDVNELEDLVMRTGYYADRYDDLLLDEFGREHAHR